MSDDFDDDLDLEEASFDDFEKKDQTLGDLWRDSSVAKIGVIAAGAIAIFGVITVFSGSEKELDPSFVPAGSEIAAPPGTEEATPAYIDAIEEESEARIEEAIRGGGSALPTPIDPPVGRLAVPEEEEEEEDPLQRWRQLQEERLQRELEQTQTVEPAVVPEDTGRSEAIQALADLMAEQMTAILEGHSEVKGVKSMTITSPDAIEKLKAEEEALEDDFFEDENLEDIVNVLMPAGEIVYSQLITEANSDVPGPVLAQILAGPLAGSRVLGTFEVNKELLTLNFSTVIVDGVSIPIEAVALDPKTTLPGMATEVDHHYLVRVILPMAAAFVEGAAEAVAETGLTTVTIQGESVAEESEESDTGQEIASGIDEAGQELGDILDEIADETEVTVIIHSGTPFGLLFLQPVIEGEDESSAKEEEQSVFNLQQ